MSKIIRFLGRSIAAIILGILLLIPIFNYFVYTSLLDDSKWYQKKKKTM